MRRVASTRRTKVFKVPTKKIAVCFPTCHVRTKNPFGKFGPHRNQTKLDQDMCNAQSEVVSLSLSLSMLKYSHYREKQSVEFCSRDVASGRITSGAMVLSHFSGQTSLKSWNALHTCDTTLIVRKANLWLCRGSLFT